MIYVLMIVKEILLVSYDSIIDVTIFIIVEIIYACFENINLTLVT